MPARTGDEFLKGLQSRGREVWLGNERVDDVVEHPSFSAAAHTLAEVYFDRQHAHADVCLIPDPETGEPINVSHMIPRSKADLQRRHLGLECISEATVGLMGRTPDYMNVTFAGFAGERGPWSGTDGRNAEGYANLVAFQQQLAREDISLTHTLVHPNNDRMVDFRPDNPVRLHKVADTEHGIIVRGSRILSTLAPFADEMAVYPGLPYPPETPPEYALSFSIPMDTPGMIFLCRDSAAAPTATDRFDRPLSSRFDEQDAFVIFDDVEVPRNRLFIDSDLEIYGSVMGPTHWWANIMQQTTIRAVTKLEFAYALATRLAEATNDTTQITIDMLGEMAGYVEVARSSLLLAVEQAHDGGEGVWFPNGRPLHPMRAMLANWFPRVRDIIVAIGGHNLLATPSRAMLDDERLRPMIDGYMFGAPGFDAEYRASLFRMAWDFVGSELGARNDLYERNYLGSSKLNRAHGHANYADRTRGNRLVEEMLGRIADKG